MATRGTRRRGTSRPTLETALRGVIIADRWPKSGVDVIVSVIEGDQDRGSPHDQDEEAWGMMNVLSNCATVASAALTDAGIDCVDTVAGGVAALVSSGGGEDEPTIVVDPLPLGARQDTGSLLRHVPPGPGRDHKSVAQGGHARLGRHTLHGASADSHARVDAREPCPRYGAERGSPGESMKDRWPNGGCAPMHQAVGRGRLSSASVRICPEVNF